MMISNEELIAALRKGREIRPLHISGTLFRGTEYACALGAIIVGLGYNPKALESLPDYYHEEDAYKFILNYADSGTIDEIWTQNDSCWYGRKEIVDSDEETIRYLTDGKIVAHNSSDKLV